MPRALRSLAGDRYIPCLVTSAMDAREVENRAISLGARKFIPKPFFPAEVVDEIRTAIAPAVGTA